MSETPSNTSAPMSDAAEGVPSPEAIRCMSAFVRQGWSEQARRGTPQRSTLETLLPGGVVVLTACVSRLSSIEEPFVATALLDGFYFVKRCMDGTVGRDLLGSQYRLARSFERSMTNHELWLPFRIDVQEWVRDLIMRESLRAQIPHEAWTGAALLAFALFFEL